MKRILWVTPDRFDEKLDKSSWLEMARALQGFGWDVNVVAGRRDASASDYNGLVQYVHALDLPFVFRVSLLFATARWLRRHGRSGDVLIVNQDALWLAPLARRLGMHVHLDFRTLPVDRHGIKGWLNWLLFWRLPVQWFARGVDGYSFITERLREAVEREFDLSATEHAIWHSAVDLERFKPAAPHRAQDGAQGPRPFRLFYHGAVTRKRGLGTVIEAIALGGAPDNFEFRIVGDGPDREDLERDAARLGVSHCVQFRGSVPYEDVPNEIAGADVCICPLPDRPEWNVSSPLKVFEYLACGKPMILTPILAHKDLLATAPQVVWAEGFTAWAMRQAIDHALSKYADLAQSVTAACKTREQYGWRTQAANLSRYLTRQFARGTMVTMASCASAAEPRP